VERRELPAIAGDHLGLRGRGVFHAFTDCSLCGCSGISGLRFRCLHCKCFDVCGECEPRLADLHDADHVFQILYENDFRYPWLPRGTRVRVVRSGDKVPISLTRSVDSLEGQVGKIVARRRPPLEGFVVELELGQGTVDLDITFLEPVLTSREEASQLLTRTVDEDGEEQFDSTVHSFADDLPHSSDSES
jgi:hypothetical protein